LNWLLFVLKEEESWEFCHLVFLDQVSVSVFYNTKLQSFLRRINWNLGLRQSRCSKLDRPWELISCLKREASLACQGCR
jgi:hypothetical protein